MSLADFTQRAVEAEEKLRKLEKQINALSASGSGAVVSNDDDEKSEWEVIYWGGITNRGQFVKLVFEEAKVPYKSIEEKEDVIPNMRSDKYGKQKREDGGAFQAMAVPQIRKGKFFLGQTIPIIGYVSQRLGLAPKSMEDFYLAQMLCSNCNDMISEIYNVRDKGEEGILAYANGRLQVWLDIFEKPLEQSKNQKYYFDGKCCQADLCVYAILKGLEQLFGDKAFKTLVLGDSRAVLAAFYQRMVARKSVQKLLKQQAGCEFFPGAFGWDDMKKFLRGEPVALTFSSDEIIPDVVDQEPAKLLTMQYKLGDKVFDLNAMGTALTPTQVQCNPVGLKFDGADGKKLYTVILTDPDARDREKHEFREWVHCVRVNVPGSDLSGGGDEVIAYVGSGPPPGSGVHRYVWLVFEQSAKIDVAKCGQAVLKAAGSGGKGRRSWKARQFAKDNNLLGHLVAGTYFNAEYDDYVPKLYEMLQGKATK